jgi:Ca2+-binding EF-hand superfamily protein
MLSRIAIVLALIAAAATAAQKSRFAALDTDGSGGVSFTELRMAYPDADRRAFAAVDVDGTGELDEAQLIAWRAQAYPESSQR